MATFSHTAITQDDDDDAEETEHDPGRSVPPSAPPVPSLTDTQLVESTVSHKLFEDLLTTYYQPLEIWYARVITEKVRHPDCFPRHERINFWFW